MKKLLLILLSVFMSFSLCACVFGYSKEIKLNETVTYGITQLTIKDVQLGNTNYVIANKKSNDFLTPINKDDIKINERFIKAPDEDDGVIVINAIIENVGKNDLNFKAGFFEINYDDGNRYSPNFCYVETENDGWTEMYEVELEKVTSGPVEVRIPVWLPKVIIEDTSSPLTLEFCGKYKYVIR